MRHKFLTTFLVLVVLCIAIGSSGPSTSKSEPTVSSGDSKKVEVKQPVVKQEEPAMKVTAKEVAAKYKENEVAGDQMYKGKKLEISGNIYSIDSSYDDSVIVRLNGSEMFYSVDCHLDDSEKSKAAQLKKGSDIVLLCTSDGEVAGSPSMIDCTVSDGSKRQEAAIVDTTTVNPGVSKENCDSIKTGMTTEKVKTFLGEPKSTTETDAGGVGKMEMYHFQESSLKLQACSVIFLNGKVQSKSWTDL